MWMPQKGPGWPGHGGNGLRGTSALPSTWDPVGRVAAGSPGCPAPSTQCTPHAPVPTVGPLTAGHWGPKCTTWAHSCLWSGLGARGIGSVCLRVTVGLGFCIVGILEDLSVLTCPWVPACIPTCLAHGPLCPQAHAYRHEQGVSSDQPGEPGPGLLCGRAGPGSDTAPGP